MVSTHCHGRSCTVLKFSGFVHIRSRLTQAVKRDRQGSGPPISGCVSRIVLVASLNALQVSCLRPFAQPSAKHGSLRDHDTFRNSTSWRAQARIAYGRCPTCKHCCQPCARVVLTSATSLAVLRLFTTDSRRPERRRRCPGRQHCAPRLSAYLESGSTAKRI